MKKRALLAVPVAVIILVLYVMLRPHTQAGGWVYGSGVMEAAERKRYWRDTSIRGHVI